MLKALEIAPLLLIGGVIILSVLMLPVLALWWLPQGKLLTPPGHVYTGRGILFRHQSPIAYWVGFVCELTLCPLIAAGMLGGLISAIMGIVRP